MTIRPASDRAALISFGGGISSNMHLEAMRVVRALTGVRGILNLHPAFASVLVDFDPRLLTHESIVTLVHQRLAATRSQVTPVPRHIEIPVSYGGEFGPDLDTVAQHSGLRAVEVAERHAAAEYVVYFLGFATCFPYLGGLPEALATPRLAAPRTQVPAGSIAIAGTQAGIYPIASPGGWQLIGRTPLALFDPAAEPPSLLRPGDRVRFVRLPESPV